MISTWERKFNKKRPKGIPKWKWYEQLKKEEVLEKEVAYKKEKEFPELNKVLREERRIRLPIWIDNVFTRLLAGNAILGLIFVPILIAIIILILVLWGFIESLF